MLGFLTGFGFVLDHVTVKLNLVSCFWALEFPDVAVTQPIVGVFNLLAIFYGLLEHAVFVTDAVTGRWNGHGGHGIQETSSQTTQTTVAQGRVVFHFHGIF